MSVRALLAALVLVLAPPSCRRVAAPARPDLLLVTVDTLRSDFLGCYGYPRNASRTLDALAEAGVRFDAHFTTIATTAPSHATLFTGLFAREHGLLKNGQLLPESLPSLPAALEDAGYRTGAAIGARIVGSDQGFRRGFEWFDEDFGDDVLRPEGKSGKYERFATTVIDRAIAFAKHDDGRPTFLWVHLYDPHEPYAPYEASPQRPERNLQFFESIAEPSASFDDTHLALMLAGYEAEVSYVDRELRRLLRVWDLRPSGPDSLVVVTSDHGEGLGEHQYQGHGFLLYEEQVRIPLLVRFQGKLDPGSVVGSITSSVDVAATVFDLLDVPAPPGLGGASLVPLITTGGVGAGNAAGREAFAERRTFSESDLERSEALRELIDANPDAPIGSVGEKCVLVRDRWKLVWNESGQHELYNLERDRREAHNLFDEHPEIAASMRERIEAWRAEVAPRTSVDGPTSTDTLEMLDALGY